MTTYCFANGVTLDLVLRDETLLGLGRVAANGVALRSPRRPMLVEIRTPDGVELCDYTITALDAQPDRLVIDLGMKRRAGGLMEWMVHEVRPRYNTADWSLPPQPATDTALRLDLRAVTRTLGGVVFAGYSYQYHYRSATLPIYKLLDRGTWEIGGTAVGNSIWQRQDNMPPLATIRARDDWYSTEWYLPSADNPNVFQFFPLQTQLQGFTFTVADAGVLVTWPTEVAHVRTLIQKDRGSDEIAHFHEHCGDLSHAFSTAPVEVLWAAGAYDHVARINLYEAVRDHVWTVLHEQIGMRQERATTYGVIEEWTEPDFERYTALGVPKLLDAGVKTIMIPNQFQNNMNVYGVGNMCCTVDYHVADSVGEDRLTRFCDAVKAGGARVEMWGNTSISTLTWILDNRDGQPKRIDFLPREQSIMEALEEAQQPWVRNPSNAIEADHYTPVFAVLNLRDPVVRRYWHARWQAAHNTIGLEQMFLDSSFNLSSDKFHWLANTRSTRAGATIDQTHLLGTQRPADEPAAAISSQYRAHLDLMVDMQRYGYVYSGEDTGLFGLSRSGPGIRTRLDNLWMWLECFADFDQVALEDAGADPDAIFFRGLAYRNVWKLYWHIPSDQLSFNYNGPRGAFDHPGAWHIALLHAFNRVGDLMRNRRVLPAEAGVIYDTGDQQVLWAFTDLRLPLPGPATIRDVLNGGQARGTTVDAARHQIYHITPLA
jgi:hypothetical protein